ncbi:MAG: NAD(P)-binding protein [Chloroflexi bacterium]|nr:NAD(P)-binding protein [Chloroflexota bacterium]
MEYDVIIVGAGSSGAVLATRLSEDRSRSVLLLDAGPDYASLDALPGDVNSIHEPSVVAHDWGFNATFVPGRDAPLPRGKLVGGSSAINTGVAIRGAPGDYDTWAEMTGDDRWAWSECLPYFRAIEDDKDEGGDFHGQGGPIPVRRWTLDEMENVQRGFYDACVAHGFEQTNDQNDPESTGISPLAMNRDGPERMTRWSANLGFLSQARNRLNLTVRGHCLVDRVLFEGNCAVGLVVECDGELQEVRGRQIILSAGAVMSPAILLRSGIGPADELAQLGIPSLVDLPGVGKHLMDHPMTPMLFWPTPGTVDPDRPLAQTLLRYTSATGEFNDMQVYLLGHILIGPEARFGAWVGEDEQAPDSDWVWGIAPGVQLPNSYGSVTLQSADHTQHPNIDLRFDEHEGDRVRLREGARLAWNLAQSEELKHYHMGAVDIDQETVDDDEKLDEWIHATATSMAHPTCTCPMGPDPSEGAVVDSEGRVYGVEGLRVVDGSIMPTLVRANTNFTCMMLGERIAEWMSAEG